MENIHRLRSRSLTNIIDAYSKQFDKYKLSREDYDILTKIEIKLYNNVILFLQEHHGDFKPLYMQIVNDVCKLFSSPCCDYNIDLDDATIGQAISQGLIGPRQIRKLITIEPKFNPRQQCKDVIISYLQEFDNANDLADRIENACYNYVIKYCKDSDVSYQLRWNFQPFLERYTDRISIVLNHLNPNSITNKTYGTIVIDNLKNGIITPEDIGTLEDTELCKESIANEINEIEIRSNQTIQKKFSTLYKCKSCGARRCEVRERQIKASDEPSDIFCTCLNCGNKFKGY